ncbi:ABC transporter permease [Pseudomonas cavernae]|uniref:ABC transporter permease n=1 Tax=Pseudomonas cavernae TaxID=2320867 RepID=A0A385YWW3_9PSED|nr:ABC transporter permease [Pseudomonas cavernae]AYC31415.1 ABC transporter permease [Pseudomonas cavernae]
MYLLRLALASLNNRRFTALLTMFAIALSVCLLLAVERVRSEARASFASTISGTDLIVGARSGSVNLLLYSVFRIGNATNNIRWDSFEHFAHSPRVKWAIPISLGDSHRGYRVMGTDASYFEHYRYARGQQLQLAQGRAFADDPFEVVLGAEVAAALHYRLGERIVLAHGVATVSLVKHDDKPFRVVGILARTGTPVDRTLHIGLGGMEALHIDWQNGVPARGAGKVSAEQVRQLARACPQASRAQAGQGESRGGSGVYEPVNEHSEPAFNAAPPSAVACGQVLTPKAITAVLLGLNSKIATFAVQREINDYRGEPLLAILPGVALQELWSLMGTAEQALFVVSLFVVLTGLIGMLTAILTSLNERRREMAILRSVGARPWHIASLLVLEAFALALAGVLLGLALLYLGIALAQGHVQSHYGLHLPLALPSGYEWTLLGAILAAALLMGGVPAWRAYRQSLADGLSIRL